MVSLAYGTLQEKKEKNNKQGSHQNKPIFSVIHVIHLAIANGEYQYSQYSLSLWR